MAQGTIAGKLSFDDLFGPIHHPLGQNHTWSEGETSGSCQVTSFQTFTIYFND
jgi:hypothetical protein